jgi:hypothetical protein
MESEQQRRGHARKPTARTTTPPRSQCALLCAGNNFQQEERFPPRSQHAHLDALAVAPFHTQVGQEFLDSVHVLIHGSTQELGEHGGVRVHHAEHGEHAVATHEPYARDLPSASTLKAQQLDGLQLTGAGHMRATARVVVHLADAHHPLLAMLVLLLFDVTRRSCSRRSSSTGSSGFFLCGLHLSAYRNRLTDQLIAAYLQRVDLVLRGGLALGVEFHVAALLAQRPA